MTFIIHELPKAKWDKHRIFQWLFEGAVTWLSAYDQMVDRLKASAGSFPQAYENKDLELDVNEVLFKTRRGRVYRAVFFIDGQDVYILRVRGPGQASVTEDDIES